MTNYDKENEKSLENSLNKAISDMDFSAIVIPVPSMPPSVSAMPPSEANRV